MQGDAYYGFGDPISTTDGTIDGFFCSWAAPGGNRTLHRLVQHQAVVFDPLVGLFEVPAGGSHITYAPTNQCTYDGEGDFWYDRNLNRMDDELVGDLAVTEPAGLGHALDLLAPEPTHDTDKDGTATVPELIEARGFVAPPL